MLKVLRFHSQLCAVGLISTVMGLLLLLPSVASALQLPPLPPDPQSSSVGLEGTKTEAPPSTAPTISIPTNGQPFSSGPVTVSGLCTSGLLVRLFSNGVFIGAAQCNNNSYSITASLFDGQNQLVAQDYDALGQSSPASNQVTVTFTSSLAAGAPQLLLTSAYAERGANPGSTLTWPISVTSGTAPYAIDIDWGDASADSLISQTLPGVFTAQHIYNQAGVYNVLVKATDQNGTVAYLQLVAIGNGTIAPTNSTITGSSTAATLPAKLIWWPLLITVPLILAAFWLGGRNQLIALRRKMEHSSEEVQKEQ